MKYENQIISRVKPANVVRGPTITWYYYDIEEYEIPVEMGEGTIPGFRYNGISFNAGEYEGVQRGTLPTNANGWDSELWLIFRTYQHGLTDSGYFQAQRHIRANEEVVKWNNYIAALDAWNNAVSALEMGNTNVPELPDPDKIN